MLTWRPPFVTASKLESRFVLISVAGIIVATTVGGAIGGGGDSSASLFHNPAARPRRRNKVVLPPFFSRASRRKTQLTEGSLNLVNQTSSEKSGAYARPSSASKERGYSRLRHRDSQGHRRNHGDRKLMQAPMRPRIRYRSSRTVATGCDPSRRNRRTTHRI